MKSQPACILFWGLAIGFFINNINSTNPTVIPKLLRIMNIAWTTTETREQAEKLARLAVEKGLAACVQIEGPITSFYRWEGAVEKAGEFRLTLKVLRKNASALKALVHRNHPYETPQWTVADLADVGEKYRKWAEASSEELNMD